MPADTASTESSMPQREMAMDFAARWPDRPEFTNVDVSALALMSNSYADTPGATDAEDELPLRSFDTETGPRQQNPAGETAFRLALLAAALGLALYCKRPHIGTTMINSVLSEGRLCGLTPSDWSVLLGSFVLCGLLTLVL
jgi:hypothetical protein